MSSQNKVHVNLGSRSYDIHIGAGLFNEVQSYVPLSLSEKTVFILTDDAIDKLGYPDDLKASLNSLGPKAIHILSLPPGEQTKSFNDLQKVINWMLDNGVTRDSVLFTVGGGVIGDLGGFAASVVMRGIPFVQVPTTLLAQVDSSVGGKTAIDVPQGKNLVGSFYQPIAVICDINTIKTLPKRELLAGYAEVVKYGLINDQEFFIWLEMHGKTLCSFGEEELIYAIKISCMKKAEIVAEDENEAGIRAYLNFGHTFAHMLEGVAGYDGRLLHGEAVSIGMVLAMQLSVRMGFLKENDYERVKSHLALVGLPVYVSDIKPAIEIETEKLFQFLKKDKKTTSKGAVFILSRSVGSVFKCDDVELDEVEKIIHLSNNKG